MSYTYYFLQYLFAVCYNDVFVLFQNYRFGSARFFCTTRCEPGKEIGAGRNE